MKDILRAQRPSVSIVICCHNSSSRLPATLGYLACQRAPQNLVWEIIVVDNASTDDTVAAARNFAARHPHLCVLIASEPKLGQTYARLRGLQEARGEIILFVDDDNWLEPEYVALVAETMEARPEIAALGGMSTAVFEEPPPEWMARHQRWFAVSGPPQDADELRPVDFIWGAGSAFRRNALEQVTAHSLRIPGRQGTSLNAGDDNELCCRLQLLGFKLFLHPGLKFQHFLPAPRVQWDYLRRLCYAAGEVSVLLDAYRFNAPGGRSGWPGWLLRSWYAQVCNVSFQLLRAPVVFWRARIQPMDGDDRVLRYERYRGRLAALRRAHGVYRQMVHLDVSQEFQLKKAHRPDDWYQERKPNAN